MRIDEQHITEPGLVVLDVTATDQHQHTQAPLSLTPLSRNREIAHEADTESEARDGAAGAQNDGFARP
ncbi:DUF6207 family protein [Streptomyces atratus]|uniref:DUF6207 family protein n=1 Tax=Streptomyces atratus TaxID=1893 RepID=UPI0036BEDC09